MYVFCDESGTDRRDGARRTGWAPKGETPVEHSVLERRQKSQILPAVTIDGFLDIFTCQGKTIVAGFPNWLRLRVLLKMTLFPGRNSILVMEIYTGIGTNIRKLNLA